MSRECQSGGGYLNKRKISDRLEKFDKYKNQKRIAVASVIGLFLLTGVVHLYKTFAYYEEKKTFNVIRGRVPDFRRGDIQFAFLVDNVKSKSIPSKNGDKVYIGYECNKPGVSIEWNNDRWAPLVVGLTEEGTSCTLKFETTTNVIIANIGDYISYTPSKTSYDITNDLTGMDRCPDNTTTAISIANAGKQTINPSELNLWRVIKKNSDGTVEVVSEYTSSNYVYFYGETGYEKLVGTLNTIAKAYETSGITVGSRYMGYSGQTATVDISMNPSSLPWPDSTSGTNSPNGSARERTGGGDIGVETDRELVKAAIKTNQAYLPYSSTIGRYFLASRYFEKYSASIWRWRVRMIEYNEVDSGVVVGCGSGSCAGFSCPGRIRPIVKLSASLRVARITQGDKEVWKIS